MKHPLSVILTTIILLAAACTDRHREYSAYRSLPLQGWAYTDTLTFSPDTLLSLPEAEERKPLKINLRHTSAYLYSNLWLSIEWYEQGRAEARTDTVNVALADIYGRWLGAGIGADYQLTAEVPQTQNADLSRPVKVRHIMRADTIGQILQIGLSH